MLAYSMNPAPFAYGVPFPYDVCSISQQQTTTKQSKQETSKKSTSISNIFDEMIHCFEMTHPKNLNVISVSEQFNISSRRVYDFFNVFTALGVCRNQFKGSIEWISINKATDTIIKNYQQLEFDSDSKSIKELFNPGPSPSLGVIASYFISLFFYLDVELLNIHKVSALFMTETSDRKSLERRLYLVLAILELVGIVYHSQRTGEYCIKLPVHSIVKDVLLKKQKKHPQPSSVLSLIANVSDTYINSIFSQRRQLFNAISLHFQ